jgi:hypothetical protein
MGLSASSYSASMISVTDGMRHIPRYMIRLLYKNEAKSGGGYSRAVPLRNGTI